MAEPKSVHPSELKVGTHYYSISTPLGIKTRTYLGSFTSRQLIGRPYDPDVILYFAYPNGTTHSFTWNMRDTFYETTAEAPKKG